MLYLKYFQVRVEGTKMEQIDTDSLINEIEAIYANPSDPFLKWPLNLRYSLPSKMKEFGYGKIIGIAAIVGSVAYLAFAISGRGR